MALGGWVRKSILIYDFGFFRAWLSPFFFQFGGGDSLIQDSQLFSVQDYQATSSPSFVTSCLHAAILLDADAERLHCFSHNVDGTGYYDNAPDPGKLSGSLERRCHIFGLFDLGFRKASLRRRPNFIGGR